MGAPPGRASLNTAKNRDSETPSYKKRDCETHITAQKTRLRDPWNSTKILRDPEFLKNHSPPLLLDRRLTCQIRTIFVSGVDSLRTYRFKMRSLKIIPEDNLEMNKGDPRKNRDSDLINKLTSRKCGKSRNISSISNFFFLFAKELRKTCFRRLSAKSLWVDLCIIYTNY